MLVVSDHGGGSLDGVVNLNAWLARARLPDLHRERLRPTAAEPHRLFELRRRLPKAWRYSVKQRLPRLRERAYRLRRADGDRLGAHARLRLRDLRQRRPQRARPRAVRGSSSRATSTSVCATSCASGCSTCARPTASRSSLRCTGARSSSTGPELEKVPDLVVEFRDYAWLGKGNLTERTPTIWDASRSGPTPSQRYAGSHRQEGIFVLAGPGGSRRRRAGRAGSPTSRRRCSTCSASRSRRARGAAAGGGARAGAARRAAARVRRRRDDRGLDRPATTRARRRRGRGAPAQPRLPRVDERSRGPAEVGGEAPCAGRQAAARRSGERRGSASTSSTSVTSPASPSRRANGSWWSSTASPKRCEPRHDDRPLAVREHGQHRADAGVADDDAGPADLLRELLVRELGDEARARRPDAGGPASARRAPRPGQPVERAQQPVEREVECAERDEDHRWSRTLPA